MGNLRKIRKIRKRRHPANNTVDYLGSENEYHKILDKTGELESIYEDEQVSNHCGCIAPPAGKCLCGNYCCARCFTHCGGTDAHSPLGCARPLCRECCNYETMPDGTSLPLCDSCYAKYARKKIWGKTRQFLPEIEIDFNE